MVVRLMAGVLLISGLALVLGCSSRAETKPPEDKGTVGKPAETKQPEDMEPVAKRGETKQPEDKDPVGKNPKADADLKLLQGSWKCTLRTIGEKELFPSQGKGILDIKKDAYGEGTLILDAKAKPKLLDVKLTVGEDKGKTIKGIYEFRDGELAWCFNNVADAPRPTSFDPAQHAKEKHAESIEICIFKREGDK